MYKSQCGRWHGMPTRPVEKVMWHVDMDNLVIETNTTCVVNIKNRDFPFSTIGWIGFILWKKWGHQSSKKYVNGCTKPIIFPPTTMAHWWSTKSFNSLELEYISSMFDGMNDNWWNLLYFLNLLDFISIFIIDTSLRLSKTKQNKIHKHKKGKICNLR